jgi:tetratricopeptide (TPR) repeat protein
VGRVTLEKSLRHEVCGVTRKANGEFSYSPRNSSKDFSTGNLPLWGCLFALVLVVAAKAANAVPPENATTLLKEASSLHAKGDYAHSIPILKRIVQRSPRNYDANLMLGEDLLHSGNVQDAFSPLQLASEMRPHEGKAQAYLAEAAARLGDYSMASEALQSAVVQSGDAEQFLIAWAGYSLDRFRALGSFLETTKEGEATELRFEAARHREGTQARESLLHESIARDPEQRGIWGELGLTQLELGKHSDALASLEEAQRREPGQAEALRLESLISASEQRWPDAQKCLSILGARSPAELQRALALWPRVLVPGPEVAGAVWDCLRNTTATCPLVAAQSQHAESLSAKDLYAEGRWEQLAALPPAISTDQNELLWRGVAFAKTGNCPQAIPALELGLKAEGRTAAFWLEVCYASEIEGSAARLNAKGNVGSLHELKGDVALQLHSDAAAAQKQYLEALKTRPNDPHLQAKLADASMQLGDGARAKSAALAALAVEPRETQALRTLVMMAMSNRDYPEALVRLKQLMAVSPRDEWMQIQLGVTYSQLGHPDEALHYLGPALAQGYPDPKGALHAMLATVLRKLGREDDAKQAAVEAARLANLSLERGGSGSSNVPK